DTQNPGADIQLALKRNGRRAAERQPADEKPGQQPDAALKLICTIHPLNLIGVVQQRDPLSNVRGSNCASRFLSATATWPRGGLSNSAGPRSATVEPGKPDRAQHRR